MVLFISILFLFILKGANTTNEDYESVNCYSELVEPVDEDSLQYRIWCDSQTSHKCCWIQEMCWTNYDTSYGSNECNGIDLFKAGELAEFEFVENANETNTPENCEIFITVLGKYPSK